MLTKDRDFYKNFFSLLIMLAVQNMIVLSVNLIDNIMIGNYSEDALGGVTAVNQIQFVFQQLLMGAGDALVVLGSQYWGQKRIIPVKKILNGGLILGMACGIILFVLACFIPEGLVSIFTENDSQIQQGTEYIRVIKYTYLVFPVSSIILSSLKSVETVNISITTSIISLIINAIINYMLIYGNFGCPTLGATGAAIGTLVARIVELLIIAVYIFRIDKKVRYKLKDFVKFDKTLVLDYLKTSVPFVVVATLFGLSTATQTAILGHLNSDVAGDPMSANSISSTLYMMLKVAAIGAASASAIIIGKTIGQNRIEKVKEYAKTLQIIYLIIGILTSVTLFTLRKPILGLYNITPETKALANSFILVLCVTCIGTSYQMPVLTGIVRGGGDSSFVLKNDIISIWCIMLPVSLLAAFVFKLHPVIVVLCLNSDQIFKCGAAFVKVNKFNWIRKLTKPDTEITEQ